MALAFMVPDPSALLPMGSSSLCLEQQLTNETLCLTGILLASIKRDIICWLVFWVFVWLVGWFFAEEQVKIIWLELGRQVERGEKTILKIPGVSLCPGISSNRAAEN